MHIRGSGRQEWRPNRQRPRHILFALIDDVDYNVARVGDLIPAYEGGKKYGLYRLSRDKKNLLWLQSNLSDVDFFVFAGHRPHHFCSCATIRN